MPSAYDHTTKTYFISEDKQRAQEWIKTGAQPTDTVRALLKRINAI